jgi:hypothetical protein
MIICGKCDTCVRLKKLNVSVPWIQIIIVIFFFFLKILQAENFNVSIPWIQMKELKIKESKFGRAIVIKTHQVIGLF